MSTVAAPYTTFVIEGGSLTINGGAYSGTIDNLKSKIQGLELVITDNGEPLCRGVLADYPGLTGATLLLKKTYFNDNFTSVALGSVTVADPLPDTAGDDFANMAGFLSNLNDHISGSGLEVNQQNTPDTSAGDLAAINANTSLGGTATISQVADSASSVTIIAANTSRISVYILNTSSAALSLQYAGTAVIANRTLPTLTQDEAVIIDDYNGIVTGIWATDPGDGNANVTEVTA